MVLAQGHANGPMSPAGATYCTKHVGAQAPELSLYVCNFTGADV